MNAMTRSTPQMAGVPSLSQLIDLRQPHHMLPAGFYTRDDILAIECEVLFRNEWLFAGVAASVPEPGDAFTFEAGKDSVIIARGDDDVLRALHNVCCHRASRVLPSGTTSVAKLVCPYHQWTYDLDGKLLFAKNMGPEFHREQVALKPAHLREVGGLLFVCLGENPPTGIDEFAQAVGKRLEPYRLLDAKVVYEDSIVENANWKLTMENNRECYHCDGGHPELTRSFPSAATMCDVDGLTEAEAQSLRDYQAARSALFEKCASLGMESERYARVGNAKDLYFDCERYLIGGAGESATMDTQVASRKLLGDLQDKVLGDLSIHTHTSWHHFYSDHAVCIHIEPLAVDRTRVVTRWLVHKDAVEGRDYDLANLTRVWKATNGEDGAFVGRQQFGVSDHAYVPGMYSPLTEAYTDETATWYLGRLREAGY